MSSIRNFFIPKMSEEKILFYENYFHVNWTSRSFDPEPDRTGRSIIQIDVTGWDKKMPLHMRGYDVPLCSKKTEFTSGDVSQSDFFLLLRKRRQNLFLENHLLLRKRRQNLFLENHLLFVFFQENWIHSRVFTKTIYHLLFRCNARVFG
jgi:hypothetical protein